MKNSCTDTGAKQYRFLTWKRVWQSIPQAVFAQAYTDAAAWLEKNPDYDVSIAILKATNHLPEQTARLASLAFYENFGCWAGDDDGVLMLCFASEFARTDSLK